MYRTVSYTHLDVYKRQALHPACFYSATPRPARRNRFDSRESWPHPWPRTTRCHPDRHHLRPAAGQGHGTLGADYGARTECRRKCRTVPEHRPTFAQAITVILCPVVLMLAASIVDLTGQSTTAWGRVLAFIGTPLTALFLTSVLAMVLLGFMQHATRDRCV